MIIHYRIACTAFVVRIGVDVLHPVQDGYRGISPALVEVPPILTKFRGQALSNLVRWVTKHFCPYEMIDLARVRAEPRLPQLWELEVRSADPNPA